MFYVISSKIGDNYSAKFFKLAFMFFTLLISCNNAFAQDKIKSATISFYTPYSDDKDWDTKVIVKLYLSDGTLVGTADYNSCMNTSAQPQVINCFCCAAPRYDSLGHVVNINTRFPDGSSKGPFVINISNVVEKPKIQTGYFTVSISPDGSDRWIFVPSLVLFFDDGTSKSYNQYSPTIVSQDAFLTTLVFH